MKRFPTLFFTTALLLLQGCGAPSTPEEETVRHAVDTAKMKRVLADMQNIVFEKQISELERDNYRLRYAGEIATLVEQIADGLETNPEIARLPEADKKRVHELGVRLRGHGKNLEAIVADYAVERLRPELSLMMESCNACHLQYRKEAVR